MSIKSLSLALAVVAFTSHPALSAQGAQTDAVLVRRAYLAYKEAILQQKGQAAVLLVDESTLRYYARMKGVALEGPEEEVRRLTPINKLMVLGLRHRIAVEELRAMTPEAIFAHGVDQGWIGKNSVLDSDIGRPRVFGNDASAEFMKGGKPTGLMYRFKKEGGKWKLDLTALMAPADQAMTMLIKKEGYDEDSFLLSLIESVSGRKAAPTIWQPPGK